MAYSPVVGRLNCGNSRDDPDGFWQLNGFGLTAVYKSDWDRFKGEMWYIQPPHITGLNELSKSETNENYSLIAALN